MSVIDEINRGLAAAEALHKRIKDRIEANASTAKPAWLKSEQEFLQMQQGVVDFWLQAKATRGRQGQDT